MYNFLSNFETLTFTPTGTENLINIGFLTETEIKETKKKADCS